MSAGALPTVAILAGGRATRLGSLAADKPKSLVTVAGEPFADRQLRRLKNEGIERVVFCVGHLGEQIRDHVGDGSRLGLHVDYSFDGDKPLGTGGAIRRALPLLGEAFFVLYGDSYLDISYRRVWERLGQHPEASALMTIYANRDQWVKSNVLYRDGRLLAYDKVSPGPEMEHIDYGLSAFYRRAFETFPEGTAFDLGEVITRSLQEGRLVGFEAEARFYEIGTPEGLGETSAFIDKRRSPTP